MSADFREINGILYNFAFCIVNYTVFLRGVNNEFDFLFGVSIISFVGNSGPHEVQDSVGHMVKHPNKWGKDFIEDIERSGNC